MGFADVWNRTLVYFGIAEETRTGTRTATPRRGARANLHRAAERAPALAAPAPARVRRLDRPGAGAERAHGGMRRGPRVVRRARRRVGARAPRRPAQLQRRPADRRQVQGHHPVILNLQGSDPELSKRLIDFASGLTYALDGGMQRVADKVFLLTPRNVEVSAEERARLLERGGFFNQAYDSRRRPLQAELAAWARCRSCSPTRSTLESFVDVFIGVYILLILAYIITSWVRLPYSPWLNRIQRFLYDVCDPTCACSARPAAASGPLDLSPIVARVRALRAPEQRPQRRSSNNSTERGGDRDDIHTRRDPTRQARRGFLAATAAQRSTAARGDRRRASRRSGASGPTSPTRSSSWRPTRPLPRAREAAAQDARLGRAKLPGAE